MRQPKAVSKVTPPGVVETAAAVEAAKAAHLEAIAQAAAKKELEETAAVESERSEEIESLVLQIKFETSYMKALDGQTCPLAEQRRAMHSANIRWYQHQKTALMEPAKQVKALTVAVGTAEKKVLAAGKVLEFAKADVVRSQEAVASALEQVEIASTNFMDVKEQLEAAQVKVDAMDTPKSAEILIGDAAATVMSHCTAAQKNIFLEFLKTLESTAGDADMGTAAVSSDPYQAVGGAMPTASSLPAAAAPGTSTNAAARAPSRIPLRTAARLRSGSTMQARIPPVSATSDPYQSIGAATSAPAAVAAPRAEAVPTATHLVKAVTNSIAGVLHQQVHGFPFPKHQVQVNPDGGIDTTQSTAATCGVHLGICPDHHQTPRNGGAGSGTKVTHVKNMQETPGRTVKKSITKRAKSVPGRVATIDPIFIAVDSDLDSDDLVPAAVETDAFPTGYITPERIPQSPPAGGVWDDISQITQPSPPSRGRRSCSRGRRTVSRVCSQNDGSGILPGTPVAQAQALMMVGDYSKIAKVGKFRDVSMSRASFPTLSQMRPPPPKLHDLTAVPLVPSLLP